MRLAANDSASQFSVGALAWLAPESMVLALVILKRSPISQNLAFEGFSLLYRYTTLRGGIKFAFSSHFHFVAFSHFLNILQ